MVESNSPSYSCRIWHDRAAIYVELACGMITRFDKTEGALSKVLKLLERESRPTAKPSKAKMPMPAKRIKPEVTSEAKGKAMEILKKRGLV
jgi:hypothetical protein